MSLKENLLLYLINETNELDLDHPSEVFTAKSIAEVFKVKRNTVSHYLNQLIEEEFVVKINTRPVYFFSKTSFEHKYYPLPACIFQSFDEIKEFEPIAEEEKDIFGKLIGSEGSLKKAITQMKSAVFYPGGLPMILCGSTGVGKSFTAELIYHYCVDKGILPKGAPFVSFNCAQYANNPELLSSHLFGYVKGAFTGASSTKEGLIEAANGGILFLDEVHWLKDEGQEKLLTFIDTRTYRRMGESENTHEADVRLIFATTKSLEEHFLQTFLRRIPINIIIPSLNNRGDLEKQQFVYLFLIQEAKKLQLPIRISKRALDILTKYEFQGNLGELKNTIKYIVGACLVKGERKQEVQEVEIALQNLPGTILERTLLSHDIKLMKDQDILIKPDSTLEQLYQANLSQVEKIKKTTEKILYLFREFRENQWSEKYFEKNVIDEVTVLLDSMIFDSTEDHKDVILKLMTANVQEAISYLERNFNVVFNGNSIYAIAHYLYYKGDALIKWKKNQQREIEELEHYINENYLTEKMYVNQFSIFLKNKLNTKFEQSDVILLSFFLRNLIGERFNEQMKAIVIAHGYATASSIANVANRLLKKNIFEAFDMPIDISVEEVASKVLNYIKQNDVSKGLIILVDMGSLRDIDTLLEKHLTGPVVIFNNVSTQMALFCGSMITKNLYLDEMAEKLKSANQTDYKIIYPKKEKKKAIISSCQTGMGTAIQIQKLLENSIPNDLSISIIPQDFNRLQKYGINEAIFSVYDVMGIIGTADPGIKSIPFISLEDIITGSGEKVLREIFLPVSSETSFNEFNKNIVFNWSLEHVINQLTILDSKKILSHVEEFIKQLEVQMNHRLLNRIKVGLFIHVSCLVERLIRQDPLETYPNIEQFQHCQKDMIEMIKSAFSVIERNYNVEINIAEIAYIYDYLVEKPDYVKD